MKKSRWFPGKIVYDGFIVCVALAALIMAIGEEEPVVTASAEKSVTVTPHAVTGDTGDLARELGQLKKQLSRLASEQQGMSAKLAVLDENKDRSVAVIEVDDGTVIDEPPLETTTDIEPPAAETVIAGYQQTLDAEAADPDWTYETETAALELLEEYQFADTELNYTECYQRACRLEFDHPEGIGDTSFVDILSMNEAFAGDFYITTETEGGINRTVMFVARAGETLPKPDQY